jgi:hypothetical protein
MNVNKNFQRMHFSYIYYISQYSYMFRPVWAIVREFYSKKIPVVIISAAYSRYNNHRENVSP